MEVWHHLVEFLNAPYEWARSILIGIVVALLIPVFRRLLRGVRQSLVYLSQLRPRRTHTVGSSLVMRYKVLPPVEGSGVGSARADNIGRPATDGGTVYLKLIPDGAG